MGCDIHLFLETFDDNKWVMVNCDNFGDFQGRNYEFFAALAGVRGYGPDPKGLPPDASESVRYHWRREKEWGCHTPTHYKLEEFIQIYLKSIEKGAEDLNQGYVPADASVFPYLYRVVLWFDC